MRFNLFDRILVVLMVLALVCISAFIVIVSIQPYAFDFSLISAFLNNNWPLFAAFAALFLLIGVRLVYCSCCSLSPAKSAPAEVVLRSDEGGVVSVTLATLTGITERAVTGVEGVKAVKPLVQPQEDGLMVRLRVTLEDQIPIPAKSEEIQNRLTEEIMTLTGIKIKQIFMTAEQAPEPGKKAS